MTFIARIGQDIRTICKDHASNLDQLGSTWPERKTFFFFGKKISPLAQEFYAWNRDEIWKWIMRIFLIACVASLCNTLHLC